jgi:hypothetical protein
VLKYLDAGKYMRKYAEEQKLRRGERGRGKRDGDNDNSDDDTEDPPASRRSNADSTADSSNATRGPTSSEGQRSGRVKRAPGKRRS